MWLITDKQKANYVNIKLSTPPVFFDKASWESSGKFTWDLKNIWIKQPNEKVDFATVNMEFLDDQNERFIVSWGMTNVMTSIINSLASWVDDKIDFKWLVLSLYEKDWYARIGIFYKWEMLKRKHPIDKLIGMTKKVRVNWKDVTDREELNTFLEKDVNAISEYLKSITGTGSFEDLENDVEFWDLIEQEAEKKAEVKKEEKAKEKAKEEVQDDDDLPF